MNKLFDRSTKAGFTLVELIVVIAILAILAGVAIPVYSNYVTKANQAADEQLLTAVNTAAAAAVLEARGVDMAKLGTGKLTAVTKDTNPTVSITDPQSPDVGTAFANRYFKGNEDSALKWYKGLNFVNGVFVGVEDEGAVLKIYVDGNGKSVVYSEAAVLAYKNSNFNKGSAPTSKWTGTVDILAGNVAANETTVNSLKNDPAFKQYLEENGLSDPTGSEVGTALVRYAASKLSNINVEDVAAAIKGENQTDDLQAVTKLISGKEYGSSAFSEKAVAAALMYAMTGSFSQSDYYDDDEYSVNVTNSNVSNLGTFQTYMSTLYGDASVDYGKYLASESYKADLEGFLSVMQLVDDNSELVKEYSANGNYKNDDIIALITGLLGEVSN